MSMQFMDGFDYLTAANLNLKWDNSPVWSLVTGVYGKGLALDATSEANPLVHTLATNFATGMIALHVVVNNLNNTIQIHAWRDTATIQVDIRMDTTGAIFFTRNGTTIGVVSPIRLVSNSTNWIEAQVIIHGSLGQANLYINGVLALSQSGLNTQSTANRFFNQVALFGSNGAYFYDSYHFWDPSAGDVTGFPYGEHIIDTKLANAVGSNTTWNRGGTNTGNNFSQVNEANEDGDTTYVFMAASGAGDIDSYGFVNLSETTGTIGTIAINSISRIDDAGPHTYDNYTLSSGNSALSSPISPGATYLNAQTFQGTDPNTGVAWTVAGRNAAQFGYKLIS